MRPTMKAAVVVALWLASLATGAATHTGNTIKFIAVGVSYFHTCGILESGSVTCWGKDVRGERTTPPDGKFISVSAGRDHTCGIRESGSVACWGSDKRGQSTPPDGKFISVSAGP